MGSLEHFQGITGSMGRLKDEVSQLPMEFAPLLADTLTQSAVRRCAICSAADQRHGALMLIYRQRFAEQIDTAGTETILSSWL